MLKQNFNLDWTVRKDGETEARPVSLPYDCMIHEKRDPKCDNSYNTGFYPGGKYVFTKTFAVDRADEGKVISVHFDGVYRNASVSVNGRAAGGHRYGYGEFDVDIGALLNYGGENTIEVVADNSETPNSRWYSGSGIFRNVYLVKANPAHIAYHGLFIRTLALRDGAAEIKGDVEVVNGEGLTVRTALCFAGEKVAEFEGSHFTATLPDARLWNHEHPNLYDAVVTLWKDGAEIDRHEDIVGLRTLEYSWEKGLLINGERVFLNGGCLHNDNGIIGAASLDDSEDRRIRKMKEAGFNAVRSSHNPMSPALMKACDRQGIYVMDEAFDMWFSLKTAHDFGLDFRRDWKAELENMIRRDRNHPCVVMYSTGNEIIDIPSPRAVPMSRMMIAAIRALDATRPIINCANLITAMMAKTTDAGIDEVDPIETLPGANTLLEGPEGNKLLLSIDEEFKRKVYADEVEDRLGRFFAEYDIVGYNYCTQAPAADLARGRRRLSCASETYPQHIAANYKVFQECPNAIGDFVWTGWDYIGEAIIGDWNYGEDVATRGLYKFYPALLAGCGQIDITGYITPMAHYRRIVLGQEQTPYITVRPMDVCDLEYVKSIWKPYDGVNSWSWGATPGKQATVQVFSNADSVELFLNGASVGTAKVQDYCAEFRLPWQPGTLKAVALDAEGRSIAASELKSAGDEVRLSASTEDGASVYGRDRLVFVDLGLTDAEGTLHADRDRLIRVRVDGDATLIGLGCARAENPDSFSDDHCHTFFGRAAAVVRTADRAGSFRLTVSSEGLEDAALDIAIE